MTNGNAAADNVDGRDEPGHDEEKERRWRLSAREEETSDIEALRRFADILCLWRICANASCRRARSCRGRAHLCAHRNFPAAPEGVRDFFEAFLAAKYAGLSFEAFKSEMEQSEEFMALSAWRRAAEASPR